VNGGYVSVLCCMLFDSNADGEPDTGFVSPESRTP
jgi:hypothetical protein